MKLLIIKNQQAIKTIIVMIYIQIQFFKLNNMSSKRVTLPFENSDETKSAILLVPLPPLRDYFLSVSS
jgi:hypothetical protein